MNDLCQTVQAGHMLPMSTLSLMLRSLTLDSIIQNQNLISAAHLVFELSVSIASDEINHKNASNELIFQLLNTNNTEDCWLPW